jgi:hypothetical protein
MMTDRSDTEESVENASAAVPAGFEALTYQDIVKYNLFSKDRSSSQIIEPVPIVRIWPRVPVLYGLLGLPDGMVVFLGESPSSLSHAYRVGDYIGSLRVTAIENEKVSFEFKGEIREKAVREIIFRPHGNLASDNSSWDTSLK